MASYKPENKEVWKNTGDYDALDSTTDQDIFEDAADSAEQLEAAIAPDEQKSSSEDVEAEGLNDEFPMPESSYFPTRAVGGAEAKDKGEFFDTEGQTTHHAGRESRLELLGQYDPPVPPDQLETQFALLQDVIETLPDDLLNDPEKFVEELLKRGVARILISHQIEDIARFNAARHSMVQTPERRHSPLEERASDHSTWTAALPLRFSQQFRDTEPEEDRNVVQTEQTGRDFKSAVRQKAPPIATTAMPSPSPSAPIPISLLSIFDQNGQTLFSQKQCELLRADIDPVTNSVHVEVRASSGPAYDTPLETSDDIEGAEVERKEQPEHLLKKSV